MAPNMTLDQPFFVDMIRRSSNIALWPVMTVMLSWATPGINNSPITKPSTPIVSAMFPRGSFVRFIGGRVEHIDRVGPIFKLPGGLGYGVHARCHTGTLLLKYDVGATTLERFFVWLLGL
jgi:hypothetical protein